MRKINRIMMITVSILLSLVLISSCMISGIFAKYTMTKNANLYRMEMKRFGVTVTATPGTSLSSEVGTSQVTAAENAITYTFTGIKIKPGDDFSDAIRFTITGTAEVPVEVRVVCGIAFGTNSATGESGTNIFSIPANIGGLSEGVNKVPVGFTFGALYYNETSDTYTRVLDNDFAAPPWEDRSANVQEETFAAGIKTKMTVSHKKTGDDYIYKTFDANDPIVFYAGDDPVNTVELGFAWPPTWPVNGKPAEIDNYNEMSTYLSDKLSTGTYAFTITYTVLIQQIQPQT